MRALLKLSGRASLGLLHAGDQLAPITDFRAVRIIFGPQLAQMPANRVVVVGPIEVLLMQDQPDFEARVRAADANVLVGAESNRFVEIRVFVAVENRPDLISFLEGILAGSRSSRDAFDPGARGGAFGDGHRVAGWDDLQFDKRVPSE